MDLHLKDRVVLITGATGGIGQALTRAFAAEGCKLAISSTSQAKLDAFTPSLGLDEGHLKTFIVDVTREEQVKAFVDGAHAAYGRLDVQIHRIEENTVGKPADEAVFASQYLDGRYCRPDEVADLALYLASDLSSHMMGSGIRLDGGLDAQC